MSFRRRGEFLRVSAPETAIFQSWTPDSRAIQAEKNVVFATAQGLGLAVLPGATPELWRVDIESGQVRKLRTLPEALSGFQVNPDGRHVAFTASVPRRPMEVWVLENFLPALGARK